MGVSYANYLASPKHRKFPFKGIIGWALLNKIPTVEDLQKKYAFKYYSTMNKAVGDVNSGSIGVNEDATKDTAVAGVYTDENGGANVVLLKDHTESARIKPSVDMTINLGGHTLSANDKVGINPLSGNLIIDGRLSGSTISMTQTGSNNAKPLQLPSTFTGKCTTYGGAYISNVEGGIATSIFANGGTLEVSNAKLFATATNGTSAPLEIGTSASATIINCDIRGYANYTYGVESYYDEYSIGVRNYGTLYLNDCYVMGTHCGVGNSAILTVNGGIYEGYGHGGLYFSNDNTASYVKDAIIRECTMPDGYTATAGDNNTGFYIGGSSTANNITVYMDNCDIYGSDKPFVLRGTDGEKNNSLYISNSTVNDAKIRIDNNTHKLYIGAGNNFTAEDTTLPEACVATDEVYRRQA
jgi:hypothetical protein